MKANEKTESVLERKERKGREGEMRVRESDKGMREEKKRNEVTGVIDNVEKLWCDMKHGYNKYNSKLN